MGRFRQPGIAAATLALLALLTITACGQTVGGEPAVEGADVAPVTVDGLGDLREMDPCGLVPPSSFAGQGQTRPLARSSLDACTLAVAVGRENVVVDFGEFLPSGATPEGVRTVTALPGDLRLVQKPVSDDPSCEMYLVLADAAAVVVSARAQRSSTELTAETVCAVGRAAGEGIAETLAGGELPAWEPPHGSYARLSACGLLPAEQVAELVGASARDVTLYPAEHQCTWGKASGETSNAQLDFTVGSSPASDARIERIAGRGTYVLPTDGGSIRVCSLTTVGADFAQAVEDEREFAVIRVLHLSKERKDPCETGRQLAKLAWPKLPAA